MVTLQLALCIVMMNVRWRFAHLWRLLSTADQLYTMVTPNKKGSQENEPADLRLDQIVVVESLKAESSLKFLGVC